MGEILLARRGAMTWHGVQAYSNQPSGSTQASGIFHAQSDHRKREQLSTPTVGARVTALDCVRVRGWLMINRSRICPEKGWQRAET